MKRCLFKYGRQVLPTSAAAFYSTGLRICEGNLSDAL